MTTMPRPTPHTTATPGPRRVLDLRLPGDPVLARLETRHASLDLTRLRIAGHVTDFALGMFPVRRTDHSIRLDATTHVSITAGMNPTGILIGLVLLLGGIASALPGEWTAGSTIASVLGILVLLNAFERVLSIGDASGAVIRARIRPRDDVEVATFCRHVAARMG